jgi:hypothetical protein
MDLAIPVIVVRVAQDEVAQGLAGLEFVVLRGCVARQLRNATVVRWLARHHPSELASLQEVADVTSILWDGNTP